MTRRKSKKIKPKKRVTPKLDTEFDCILCGTTKSINIDINYKLMTGSLVCRECYAQFSCPITKLSLAVDIYSEWVDETEGEGNNDNSKQIIDYHKTQHDLQYSSKNVVKVIKNSNKKSKEEKKRQTKQPVYTDEYCEDKDIIDAQSDVSLTDEFINDDKQEDYAEGWISD